MESAGRFWAPWLKHLADPALRRTFAIGFLILFGFIGVFTYVGFVLMRPPQALSMTALGLVFLVFLPSMVTTPMAGSVARSVGPGPASAASLALALVGLVMVLLPSLAAVIAGMTLIGVGTFFAQAVATGHVGRIAKGDKAAASGLYLSSYYCGGLAGAAVIGQLFDRLGWTWAIAGVFAALALAAVLGMEARRAGGCAMSDRYRRGVDIAQQLSSGSLEQFLTSRVAEVAPDFARMAIEFPFGDLYARDGLDLKSREIVAIAALATLGHKDQLRLHVAAALGHGLERARGGRNPDAVGDLRRVSERAERVSRLP